MCDCKNIFKEFIFTDLITAKPPDERGVYVIRIKARSLEVNEMLIKVEGLLEKFNWPFVKDFIRDRCYRLNNISKCNYIYIGRAGKNNGKNTLEGRFDEFKTRHTIMYPLWVLIYFDWKLEYGYRIDENPIKLENFIKEQYKKLHNNQLPALVKW